MMFRLMGGVALLALFLWSSPVWGADDAVGKVIARADNQMGASYDEPETPSSNLYIEPRIGLSGFTGSWGNRLSNRYRVGVGIDMALWDPFGIEVEAAFSEHEARTSLGPQKLYQYEGGASLVLSKRWRWFRPKAGVGLNLSYYDGSGRSFLDSSLWGLSGQALVGASFFLNDSFGLGVRGSLLLPLDQSSNAFSMRPELLAVRDPIYRISVHLTFGL